MLNIQLLILVELFDAFLEECLFHGIVSMGVEKNRSAMLPIPHQNGIMHQAELIRLSVETFTDLTIIGDVSEELLIPIIRQIIMIPSEQNLLTFKLRDQCDECFVSTPHGHIPKNINGIAVGDLGVPMLKDTAVLETVFRQASNSRIITNAYAINHNDTHLQFGDDFQFLEVQNSEEAAQLVIKNYLREVSLHGIEDVQILSPLRKRGAVAANALNETIRDLVNPPNNLKKEVKCGSRVFRVGDRIMQTANRINVSNGDVGVITDMKKEDDETITCVRLLDGRTLQYTQEMLEDLEFSYCTTIHKSQGQEYPVIIVPLLKEHYIMLRRNLLYTAVTRAKAKVILIGQKQAVFVAIHKCDVGQRNTVLADRIVAYYNRELSRRVA